MVQKLIREEVKSIEEQFKEQKELSNKVNSLVSKLEDHEKTCIKEINTKLEIFEKN